MFPSKICKNFFCLLDKMRPFHDEIKVSKREVAILPWCFEETVLGFKHECLRQFRGPFGLHAREYSGYFLVHRDISDPTAGLDKIVEHLVFDVAAPEFSKHFNTMSNVLSKLQNLKTDSARKNLTKKSRQLVWTAKMFNFLGLINLLSSKDKFLRKPRESKFLYIDTQ